MDDSKLDVESWNEQSDAHRRDSWAPKLSTNTAKPTNVLIGVFPSPQVKGESSRLLPRIS
jgi:hypothetical protein